MKRTFVRLLSAALAGGMLISGAAAATLQSGQAVYQLSFDPLGTEPFPYSDTETYSATLVPVGTRVESDSGAPLLVEVFTYHPDSGHWGLDSILSGQAQVVVRDDEHLFHISTMAEAAGNSNQSLDRGIWLKAPERGSQPASVTGEPVDEWALNLVNEAIADNLLPGTLKGQDLRETITRGEFAALAVRLYEAVSGQTAALPEGGSSPFADTSDPEVRKAYALGFTAGVSETSFGPDQLLTREQAAVMLSAVCRALGTSIPAGIPAFTDGASISPWARDSVAYMAQSGILAGYGDGRFGPQDSAQRQACLIMALRIYQGRQG